MPMASSSRIPKYCLHKGSGQAYVTIEGARHYLGVYGSDESRERYDRFVGELVASRKGKQIRAAVACLTEIRVVEILDAYLTHAEGYYQKGGKPTAQLALVKASLRPVRRLYGRALATEFGPTALKAVRQAMVESYKQPAKNGRPKKPLCRNEVNRRVRIVKHAFKWAVSEELLPVEIYQALLTVDGLRRGRTAALDHPPVQAVADEVVDGTIPHLPEIVAGMVRLQRLTAMRPMEICLLRPCDIDRSEDVWVYKPASHKTEHFGRSRTIFLGPKAQAVLTPFLLRPAKAYCFCPDETVKRQHAKRAESRKTPLSCGNRPGSSRVRAPKRKPRERYHKNAYSNAVRRAIRRANVERRKAGLPPLPRWTPNMLRHSAATEIRRQFDLEAAQSILGHASMNTSEIYAEKNLTLARQIAAKIG
ncbi:MAG: site-specific integrase [Planctomycetaceae bacterium]|nr:site-specific integrase [Planctomycetaceae bacterium]